MASSHTDSRRARARMPHFPAVAAAALAADVATLPTPPEVSMLVGGATSASVDDPNLV
eukprot:COSAG06_NODE_26443_length_614_cov_1.988350_1_plen_57_part_10